MLSVAEPVLGDDERAALAEVIDSGWITMGARVEAFEAAFASLHGMDHAVAVSSATAGLHLALVAAGIGPGDEVLVPSLTFVATVNAVLYVGARPVFVDIEDAGTPLMSIRDAARKVTDRTRAAILVHYAGYLADGPAWRAFADAHGLAIVEDAAHAAGAPGVGRIGEATVFSFYGNKNMTTAEGGMVVSQSEAVLERVRKLRAHGMTTGTFERHGGSVYGYDVTMLGFNYRMDELRAALGLVQLEKLEGWNDRRGLLTRAYRRKLRAVVPEISVPFAEIDVGAFHIMPVLVPRGVDKKKLAAEMRDCGVQTSVHYPPVHSFTFYGQLFPDVQLPVTEDFAARELTLPLHPRLDEGDVDTVVDALARCLAQQQEVADERI